MELKMWRKINQESEKLYLNCVNKNLTITTAESCTGGMISSAIVHINGSSQIFKSSVIVYSNDMKSNLLDIPKDLITKNGAVSEIVAFNMAKKSLEILLEITANLKSKVNIEKFFKFMIFKYFL